MLTQYFGFHEDPFGATPDPRYLYSSRTHREALASLQYGFYNNRGFTALIAPPGMGKTTLLFHFLDHIRETARSVFMFNTQCEPRELVSYILRDIGIVPGAGGVEMHEQLNGALIAAAREGRRFVLVIDEAQNLSDAALETVRLLTNFETSRAKLIQVVLAGQPQLSDKLMCPSLVQLRQRISNICRLEAFSKEETVAYIGHRLAVAGYDGPQLFTAEALNKIAEGSQGIPRTINNLCFNALSLCRALKRKRVDGSMVAEVIADQQLTPRLIENSAVRPEIAILEPVEPGLREQDHWFTKVRVPALAALVLLCVASVIGASRFYEGRYQHPAHTGVLPTSLPPQSTPQTVHTNGVVKTQPKIMPIDVTVESQQSLSDISVRNLGSFNSDLLRQIQDLNPGLTDPNLIQPGQKILLPKSAVSPAAENVTPKHHVRNLP